MHTCISCRERRDGDISCISCIERKTDGVRRRVDYQYSSANTTREEAVSVIPVRTHSNETRITRIKNCLTHRIWSAREKANNGDGKREKASESEIDRVQVKEHPPVPPAVIESSATLAYTPHMHTHTHTHMHAHTHTKNITHTLHTYSRWTTYLHSSVF